MNLKGSRLKKRMGNYLANDTATGSDDSLNSFLDSVMGSKAQIMASQSLAEMAKYADHVCAQNASSRTFCAPTDNPEETYQLWNGTSVGNAAFLALYGHSDFRQDYRAILRGFFEHEGVSLCFEI